MAARELAPGSIVERLTRLIIVIGRSNSYDSFALTHGGPLTGYIFMSEGGVKWQP